VHVRDIYEVKKLANSDLMQAYTESLIQFGLTRTKLPTFLNQSQSTCGWTILSLAETGQLHVKRDVTAYSA